MDRAYVDRRNGGYYAAGTRVSLDSIVYAFRSGDSPETIRQNFPSLTLEQVYGAITFYLAHQEEVEANIREGEAEIDRLLGNVAAAVAETTSCRMWTTYASGSTSSQWRPCACPSLM